jgi:hypothetical protein
VQAGPGLPQRKVGKVFHLNGNGRRSFHLMKAPSLQEGAPQRSKQNFGVLCNFQLPKSLNILKSVVMNIFNFGNF